MYIRYGHLAEVIIPLLCRLVKKREKRQIATVIALLSNIFGYLLPVLVMCYYACGKYFENLCYFDTPYSSWVYFEVLFFICWIFSTSLFILLAYSCKYRSH